MNNNYTSTFEQSKKLWNLGFRPKRFEESPFVWSQNKNCKELIILSHVSQKPQSFCKEEMCIWWEYPAYIVSEIMDKIPWIMDVEIESVIQYFIFEIIKGEENYTVGYFNTDNEQHPNEFIVFRNEILTFCVMDLFIWLIDNQYIRFMKDNDCR